MRTRRTIHEQARLTTFVDAALALSETWEKATVPHPLAQGYPEGFALGFDTMVEQMQEWLDSYPDVLPLDLPAVGTRVVFVKAIDRYPHARIQRGELGTVKLAESVSMHETLIEVRPDITHPGLAEWEHCVLWSSSMETLDDFDTDTMPLVGPPCHYGCPYGATRTP